jgi:hypothetical protein
MDLPFPTGLGLDEQRDLVAQLDSVMIRVDELRSRQQIVETDIAALMPSILDHAFRGALDASGDLLATAAAVG